VRRTTAERLFFAYAGVAAAVVVFLFLGDRIPGILVWLGWFGLATVGGVGLYHSYRSSRSLRELRAVAQRIAAGEEIARPTTDHPGELGAMARSLGTLAEKLDSKVRQLTAERDLLETVISEMEEAILVLRPDARILLYNRAARNLFGLSDRAAQQALVELVRFPAILDAVYDAIRGRPAVLELEIPGPPRRFVVGRARPLPKGTEAAVLIVARDVTELRRLEAMRRDFVANVSHEFRTPVASIRGLAETLASGALEDPEVAPRFVEQLLRQAERLSELVERLLDLGRLESGAIRFDPKPLELAGPLSRLVDSRRAAAEAKRIELQLSVADGITALSDPTALDIVVGNLLDNAIKFTPEGGRVVVRAVKDGARVRIEVEDTGPGIEPRHLERIFERFYRVDPGRARDAGGSGLGLSIARHAAQQSGGDLEAQSTPGKGSRFTFRLPSARSTSV